MEDSFSRNLLLLCSHFRSVSDVCRRLAINRSQFNKYLQGTVRPSRHNLRRICDFFGVEEHEVLLPAVDFAELLRSRPAAVPAGDPADEIRRAIGHLQNLSKSAELQAYLGYYFEYYYSMSSPGRILKTLVHVAARGDAVVYDRIERLAPVGSRRRGARCHYQGHALFLKDRLFLTDYETLTGNEVSQTILFANYRSVIDHLDGLKIGVAATGKRTPAASRVTWQYIGRKVDPRRAFRCIGLIDPDDCGLDAAVRDRIDNRVHASPLFLAHPGEG